MDEHLRNLERLAQTGDPEAQSQFRNAYDRAYGAGAFNQRQYQQRLAQERQERRIVVDQVATLIAEYETNDQEITQETVRQIIGILTPLLENGEIDFYDGWAPGSGGPDVIIFTANWNEETQYNRETGEHQVLDNSLHRLSDLLERLPGVEIAWSDCVSRCDECNRCIVTEAQYYGWTRPYVILESAIICRGCIQNDPQPLLDHLEGNANEALVPALNINLVQHGYIRIPAHFQSGLHPGQTDSPQAVAGLLGQLDLEHFIVQVEDVGQFDSEWFVWVENYELQDWLEDAWEDERDRAERSPIISREASRYVAYLLQHPALIPEWPENRHIIAAATQVSRPGPQPPPPHARHFL